MNSSPNKNTLTQTNATCASFKMQWPTVPPFVSHLKLHSQKRCSNRDTHATDHCSTRPMPPLIFSRGPVIHTWPTLSPPGAQAEEQTSFLCCICVRVGFRKNRLCFWENEKGSVICFSKLIRLFKADVTAIEVIKHVMSYCNFALSC